MSLVTLTVPPHLRAVRYVDGAFSDVLAPGRHRKRRHSTLRFVSTREQLATLAAQDVPTSDGVSLRVTVAVRWRVADAHAFVDAAEDPFALVYLAVQVALRDSLAEVTASEGLGVARSLPFVDGLRDAARSVGAPLGIDVVDVAIKDVMLPFELRAAMAELVTAKARGAAQLEAARAETAALRSLANSAKLLDDHPGLARLRLIQALPAGSKVEIVAGT